MIRYDTGALANGRDIVHSTRIGLHSDNDEMNAFVDRTLFADWQGRASEGAQRSKHKWNRAHEHHQDALRRFSEALDACQLNSMAVENACTRAWGG
jgi:uncharacterized protein YukE